MLPMNKDGSRQSFAVKNDIITGAVIMHINITERIKKWKEAEEQHHLLAVQNEAILNTLPVNIALINVEGIIISVNKAWVNFAVGNGLQINNSNIGDNYIAISENATGDGEQCGKEMAEGIRSCAKR